MTRALVLLVALAVLLPAKSAHAAGCTSVRLGGHGYVLERFDVGCAYSKRWSKRLYASKGKRKPSGFNCKSFTKWKSSGQCLKKGNPRIGFSWRPAD